MLDDRLTLGLMQMNSPRHPSRPPSSNLYAKIAFAYVHKLTLLINQSWGKRHTWESKNKKQNEKKHSSAVLTALGTWRGLTTEALPISHPLAAVVPGLDLSPQVPAKTACSDSSPSRPACSPSTSFGARQMTGWIMRRVVVLMGCGSGCCNYEFTVMVMRGEHNPTAASCWQCDARDRDELGFNCFKYRQKQRQWLHASLVTVGRDNSQKVAHKQTNKKHNSTNKSRQKKEKKARLMTLILINFLHLPIWSLTGK